MTDRPRADPPAELTLADLMAAYPDWLIRKFVSGRIWATWPRQLSDDELKADWQRTLDADDEVGMHKVLEEEETKRRESIP